MDSVLVLLAHNDILDLSEYVTKGVMAKAHICIANIKYEKN